MKRLLIGVLVIGLSSAAWGLDMPKVDNIPTVDDTQLRAVTAKLIAEINESIEWRKSAFQAQDKVKQLQDQLDKANARVKELEGADK